MATVDDKYKYLLVKHIWYKNPDGYYVCNWTCACGPPTLVKMHKMILLLDLDLDLCMCDTFLYDNKYSVDHKNHNIIDNRVDNLRMIPASMNSSLKRPKGSSKYKGVYKQGCKWVTKCSFNGKNIHLGRFDSEKDAAMAYNKFLIDNKLTDMRLLNDLD